MESVKRGVYRGQITRLAKVSLDYLKSNEAQAKPDQVENFDAALEELQSLLMRIRTANEQLQQMNEKMSTSVQQEDLQRECEIILEYNDKFIDTESRLLTRINHIKAVRDKMLLPSADSHRKNEKCAVKLPKLELKRFSGESIDWLPFWEQFKALVHENDGLSASDKFSYLQSVLYGRAAKTIAGFSPNSQCYDAAIALLQEEFGDNEKLIERHMQELMSLNAVPTRQDVVALRHLYNVVVSNTRSLTALGVSSNNYYVMLKTVLLRCLPRELRVEFYREHDPVKISRKEELANFEDDDGAKSHASTSASVNIDRGVNVLLKFIRHEIESLERANVGVKESRAQFSTPNEKTKTVAALSTPMENTKYCIFCKSDDHYSGNCEGRLRLSDRKDVLKKEGRCFKCMRKGHTSRHCSVQNIRCRKCNGRHFASMCDPTYLAKREPSSKEAPPKESIATNLYSNSNHDSYIYLQTACAFVSQSPKNSGQSVLVRMIIDSGSQRSYIKESIARSLNLRIIDTVKIRILPFGCAMSVPARTCDLVKVCVRSLYDEQLEFVTAVVVPDICVDTLPVPNPTNENFKKFILADSRHLGTPVDGISMLIGSDYYWKIVSGEFHRITDSLTAVGTKLGWTIQGPQGDERSDNIDTTIMYSSTLSSEEFSETSLNKMWELEAIGINPPSSCLTRTGNEIDQYIDKIDNRYVGSLLWLTDHSSLFSYREGAHQRFHNLVRKLSREPHKLIEYDSAMQELISTGVAEQAESKLDEGNLLYYMPHRPVYRYDKITTQLRIVFDASAHSANNVSLNDCLDAGPNLLPEILKILLNFRIGHIALVADIEKAFLQILLSNKDRDVHRFFWFSEPIKSITNLPTVREYCMTRVTFGVKCSPFLLCATIQHHLTKEKVDHPEVCALLQQSFYMDDLVTSTNSYEFAKAVYTETSEIMKRASMNVRKWNTNCPSLRQKFAADSDLPTRQKILGIIWCSVSDEIAVDLQPVLVFISQLSKINITKRTVLQLIARVYDPLGILSPFIIKVKILFQRLWRENLPWDECLSREDLKSWNKCCQELSSLKDVFIPRTFWPYSDEVSIQIHIFADASPLAYGTVAYMRTQIGNTISTRIICAKSRVAPLKRKESDEMTVPKLELTAALIAARLWNYLRLNTSIGCEKVYLWTDSRIALYWINGNIRKWSTYVANRVREIREYCSVKDWNYCPGELNPADFLTKGAFGKNTADSSFWLTGPTWLAKQEQSWPLFIEEEIHDSVLFSYVDLRTEPKHDFSCNALLDITKYSSYVYLLRVTAYVQRFIKRIKKVDHKINKFLNGEELQLAETYWIKNAQHSFYSDEIRALIRGKSIPANSNILTLNPILDTNGVLRVGTRLQCMDSQYENIFSAILPRSCYFTKLMILDAHSRTLHGGVNVLLCRVREKFWIPKARSLMKTIVHGCRICRKLFSKAINQPFAPLPRSRLVTSKPFQTVGIDFAGPLYVKSLVDEAKMEKAYIMLFTCATVRAVHLELVPNMTLKSCLLALRRFTARRGVPERIISDNARTFKRAAKELQELGNVICAEEFQTYVTNCKISWEFIVDRAPWWGGFWERLIQSTKNILKLTVGKARLNTEELQTVLIEAESIINSRPLTYISDDPKDLTPLTPSHFLQPSIPLVLDFSKTTTETSSNIRQLWKERSRLIKFFWKRWKLEYIQLLRSSHQSKKSSESNIHEGDVVILQDQSAPRLLWKLALVEKVFPGRDGRVRSCEIRLHNGTLLRRPIQLLYPLETAKELSPTTAGPGGCQKS